MAFKFTEVNTTFPAEVTNGKLIVHVSDDVKVEYSTDIKCDLPLQLTGFHGKGVMFCFMHENLIYVGRSNGTWTAYRSSDYLIKKQGKWTADKKLILVGSLLYQMTSQNVFAIKGVNDILLPSAEYGIYRANEQIDFAPEKVDDCVGNLLIPKQLLIYTKGGRYDFEKRVQWTPLPIPSTQFSLG